MRASAQTTSLELYTLSLSASAASQLYWLGPAPSAECQDDPELTGYAMDKSAGGGDRTALSARRLDGCRSTVQAGQPKTHRLSCARLGGRHRRSRIGRLKSRVRPCVIEAE